MCTTRKLLGETSDDILRAQVNHKCWEDVLSDSTKYMFAIIGTVKVAKDFHVLFSFI